jgi:hypothetical protein
VFGTKSRSSSAFSEHHARISGSHSLERVSAYVRSSSTISIIASSINFFDEDENCMPDRHKHRTARNPDKFNLKIIF